MPLQLKRPKTIIIATIIGLTSACSSTAQPDPESPETTSLTVPASTLRQPETVTFESCTVIFDQIPSKPLGFADVGTGGFVPGEGDCGRLNFYTGASGDPVGKPWNEQDIELCSLTPVPDIGVTGDYSIHIQTKNGEEVSIERDQTTGLPGGTTIDSIRFELGDNLDKPLENGNDYLGKCQIAATEKGTATEIGFSLDITETTQPEPDQFSPQEE